LLQGEETREHARTTAVPSVSDKVLIRGESGGIFGERKGRRKGTRVDECTLPSNFLAGYQIVAPNNSNFRGRTGEREMSAASSSGAIISANREKERRDVSDPNGIFRE